MQMPMTPMTVAPVASPALHVLFDRAFGRLGLDGFARPSGKGGCGCDLWGQGCTDRDGGGDGKSFEAHCSLLDIVGSGMCPMDVGHGRDKTSIGRLNGG